MKPWRRSLDDALANPPDEHEWCRGACRECGACLDCEACDCWMDTVRDRGGE